MRVSVAPRLYVLCEEVIHTRRIPTVVGHKRVSQILGVDQLETWHVVGNNNTRKGGDSNLGFKEEFCFSMHGIVFFDREIFDLDGVADRSRIHWDVGPQRGP